MQDECVSKGKDIGYTEGIQTMLWAEDTVYIATGVWYGCLCSDDLQDIGRDIPASEQVEEVLKTRVCTKRKSTKGSYPDRHGRLRECLRIHCDRHVHQRSKCHHTTTPHGTRRTDSPERTTTVLREDRPYPTRRWLRVQERMATVRRTTHSLNKNSTPIQKERTSIYRTI